MSAHYEVVERGDVAEIRLTATIDRDADESLTVAYEAAEEAAPAIVELNFRDVHYINSTGIALIVGLLARARARGLAMRAVGLTPHYRHIFQITRLSDFIEILRDDAQELGTDRR